MDAREHPDVTRAIKAKELTSDKTYRQDWEDEKSVVYFPYTFTPEYETKAGNAKLDNNYTLDHEKTKDKNRYDVTHTPTYAHIKEHEGQTADIKYHEDYEKNRGKMLG